MALGLFVDASQDQGLNSSSFQHKQRSKQTTRDAASSYALILHSSSGAEFIWSKCTSGRLFKKHLKHSSLRFNRDFTYNVIACMFSHVQPINYHNFVLLSFVINNTEDNFPRTLKAYFWQLDYMF